MISDSEFQSQFTSNSGIRANPSLGFAGSAATAPASGGRIDLLSKLQIATTEAAAAPLRGEDGSSNQKIHWCSSGCNSGGLTVERTAMLNSVTVTLPNVFEISAMVVPIMKEDDRAHGYRDRILSGSCGCMGEEMPINRIAIGDAGEACHPAALRAALAEFISMIIFVFAGQGSGMAFSKITYESPLTPTGLLVAALAHAFALSVAVSVGANISGGHVNPAVTFGAFLGGNITLLRAMLYWIAQLLGSVVACVLLKHATGGMIASASALSSEVSVWNAMLLEIVMTFGLVYTVYATVVDPKKGNLGIVAPIMIGLIVGANILVGGAFDGASMNPAASFGPAVVSRVWKHHWVFWVGPMIGAALAALAALVYDMVYIGSGV